MITIERELKSMLNMLHLTSFIQDKLEILSDRGITLKISHDISKLHETAEKLGREISPLFDLNYFDLTPDNFFWIYGEDKDKNIIHIQTSKVQDTGKQYLVTFLDMQLKRAFQSSKPRNLANSPPTNNMQGLCAYQGDFWIAPSYRGTKLQVAEALGQLGVAITYASFRPDYIYAFIEDHVAKSGLVLRWGLMNFAMLNEEWAHADPWLLQQDYIAYVSISELDYFFRKDRDRKHSKQRQRVR